MAIATHSPPICLFPSQLKFIKYHNLSNNILSYLMIYSLWYTLVLSQSHQCKKRIVTIIVLHHTNVLWRSSCLSDCLLDEYCSIINVNDLHQSLISLSIFWQPVSVANVTEIAVNLSFKVSKTILQPLFPLKMKISSSNPHKISPKYATVVYYTLKCSPLRAEDVDVWYYTTS